MFKYPKIQTLYKRDPENNNKTLLEGQYSLPIFEDLEDLSWEFTEQVDGMNMQAEFNSSNNYVSYYGRAEVTKIPPELFQHMEDTFKSLRKVIYEMFPDKSVVFFGEGYGKNIQKGGELYRNSQRFILFDIAICPKYFEGGSRNWTFLHSEKVREVATELDIDSVPVIGYGTLKNLYEYVDDFVYSNLKEGESEGIVARPEADIIAGDGSRIITKLKGKDFRP